jgi:archaemetzincin
MAVKELQLVPVGPVLGTFLKELEAPIAQVLGVEAYLGKATLGQPTFAFNKDRNQYHTTAIMRRLLTLKDPGAPLIIGVADVDLFVPDSPFVYGEADRESHVAVMSLWRLKGEGDAWKRRTFVEAVHQAGHLIGLSYCEDARCAMYLATTITDAERRQLHLCNNCRNELVKIRKV